MTHGNVESIYPKPPLLAQQLRFGNRKLPVAAQKDQSNSFFDEAEIYVRAGAGGDEKNMFRGVAPTAEMVAVAATSLSGRARIFMR